MSYAKEEQEEEENEVRALGCGYIRAIEMTSWSAKTSVNQASKHSQANLAKACVDAALSHAYP